MSQKVSQQLLSMAASVQSQACGLHIKVLQVKQADWKYLVTAVG